jgi:NADH-quinone oxidoreductase subunit M
MIAHGFLAALTFALTGYLQQQTGTLEMPELGGLLRKLPFIGSLLLMAAFAGCGLPGFANFTGEVTVFFGSWKALPLVTIIGCWGALIVGAIYMLRAVRNVLHGPVLPRWNEIVDAPHFWRKLPFLVLLACLLLFGCFPGLLTEKIKVDAQRVIAGLGGGEPGKAPPNVARADAGH